MTTTFFDSLIDDFSIWEHTDGKEILYEEGYALDDAARGLLLTLLLNHKDQSEVLFNYLKKSHSNGGLYGGANKARTFVDFPASEDAIGQTVWVLGLAASKNFHTQESLQLIKQLRKNYLHFQSMRGTAYAMLGLVYVPSEDSALAYKSLADLFEGLDASWFWPEDTMTYGNGIMAYALLRYALTHSHREAGALGLKIITFIDQQCRRNRILGPIGNDGWLKKNAKVVPTYSQQPIDTAYMIWAWLAAYQVFQKPDYLAKAQDWFNWFESDNLKHELMYDPQSNKCYDGIDRSGIHYHSGAESNICFLLSKFVLKEYRTF